MNASNKLTWAALAIAITGAAISVAYAAPPPDTPATATAPRERPAMTVSVTQLRNDTLPVRIPASGNIMAWQEVSLGAEVGGVRLVTVHVQVGDSVRRGQLLATLAADGIRAELAARHAAVMEARVALTEAAGNAQRARSLEHSGALSDQQVQQQLAAEAAAQARLDAALAATSSEQLRLAQTRILAPDDGVISARSATVGALAASGQELFRLIRGNRLEWRAEVSSADLARLKGARQVRITLADGEVVDGHLRSVAPLVDLQTRNGLAYVDMPRHGGALAGMFAQGEFDLGATAAMTLPSSAVQVREGFHYAWRVGTDSRVAKTKVRVGRQFDGRTEILGGLERGARVVASGTAFLADNDLVQVAAAGEGAAR